MKELKLYEPAMCCNSGVSGVGVDPELMRISAVLKSLSKHDIMILRYNLSSNPMAFIENAEVNTLLMNGELDKLPVTTVDGKIVLTGRYPTNEEFAHFLEVPQEYVGEQPKILNIKNIGG